MTSAAINKLILFRNTATTTNTTSLGTTTSYTALQANNFSNYYLGLNLGPAGVASVSLTARFGTSQDFGAVNPGPPIGSGPSTRTDQNFVTRAELIAFFNSGSSLPQNINALQYLGTFSREKNIATWRANGNGPTTNNIENALNAGRFYMANLDWVRPL